MKRFSEKDRKTPEGQGVPASCAAVIAAGGEGLRMGGKVRKQFLELAGKSILQRSIELFLSIREVKKIVVVLPHEDVERFRGSLQEQIESGMVLVVPGGATRQESVYNGLEALDPETVKVVAIHDAARPLARLEVMRETLMVAGGGTGAVACAPVRDTVKKAGSAADRGIEATVDRSGLWLAQTPQSFPLEMILNAHRTAREEGFIGTDDASLCERLGLPVRIVASDEGNLKITKPADMDYLQYRLRREDAMKEGAKGGPRLRIGEGWDVHALAGGRKLVLGSVVIPFEKGLAGHSDADVLCHAITDALLGAAALGDIGRHFPDTDPELENADSSEFLLEVVRLLQERGLHPVNLDATVVAQRPRLEPYMEQIKKRLAELLGLKPSEVNVKAKTSEGLGSLGRGEGIAARAVVLVGRRD